MIGLGGETQDCSRCHKSPQSASAPATCRCHRAPVHLSSSVCMDCPCPVTINTRQGPQSHWITTNDTINGLQTFFYHCLKPILSNFWHKKLYQHQRTMGLNQTRNNGDPADEEKVEPNWSHTQKKQDGYSQAGINMAPSGKMRQRKTPKHLEKECRARRD